MYETREQVTRRTTRRGWQRLADHGLCCARCGGVGGVWVRKVLCASCTTAQQISNSASEL
jgi:hypothetical protein